MTIHFPTRVLAKIKEILLFSRQPIFGFLCLIILLTSGCQNTRPGGHYLYENEIEPPRLLDSEIKIETFHNLRRQDRGVELRIIRLVNGAASASVTKPKLAGEASLTLEVYADIWRVLHDAEFRKMEFLGLDLSGGPFHVVTATLGREIHQFTAQYTTNILGLNDSFRNQPVEAVNKILRLLDVHVKTMRIETQPTSTETRPTTPESGRTSEN